MKLPAPAKVNLHLRILGRREDGFHDLETLMLPVSLADEITVTLRENDPWAASGASRKNRGEPPLRPKTDKSDHPEGADPDGITLTCDDPEVPLGADNLVVRAARAFFRYLGRDASVRIEIAKRIPMGAGLGGGSSDAAATLKALNTTFAAGLSMDVLRELAGTLGSDVPFFIDPQPAWCRGRGEVLEPMEAPESLPLLLVKPPFGVETPWAYRNWEANRKKSEVQDLDWIRVQNDLEAPVFEKFLVLPVLKQWLRDQPEVRAAAMSGSGSTVFAVLRKNVPGEDLAARTREYFGEPFWTALCATTRSFVPEEQIPRQRSRFSTAFALL